jgi:UDP-glucuronate 4-epimerase
MNGVALVTGAAGFVGSHLTERLLDLGYEVIGIDNFDDGYSEAVKRGNIRGLESRNRFRLWQGDVRDAELLSRVFASHDIGVVAHLAGRAGVRPSLECPQLYQDVNVGGTVNLLEASRISGVERFIFASSSSVYGDNTQPPFSEEANVSRPVSPYAASKASAELFCRAFSHLYEMPVTALRFFTVYGPRQRPEMAIHGFVRMVHQGETVTFFNDTATTEIYTYVADIIDGIERAIRYRGEPFEIINLGGGRTVSLNELIGVIEGAVGSRASIEYVPQPPGEVRTTIADISKARATLGYEPKTSVEEGVRRFVDWYMKNITGVPT